ncbi:MAG: hypothetical protein JSU82_10810 [Rhodospirillales bacterium]|nr:MAG: hypothetical protein JSU82_10810 [Rhodospirillales bacterium]
MRIAAVACLVSFMALLASSIASGEPQRTPAEPPLAVIVAHFYPGYVPVTLGDLDPQIGALTVKDPAYDHSDRSPTAVRADFDGNGHADYALLIKQQTAAGSDEIFVILMGHGGGRYARAMESFFGPLSDDIYLGYLGRDTELRPAGAASDRIVLKAPAVTLNVLNHGSDVLLWDPSRNSFDSAPIPE